MSPIWLSALLFAFDYHKRLESDLTEFYSIFIKILVLPNAHRWGLGGGLFKAIAEIGANVAAMVQLSGGRLRKDFLTSSEHISIPTLTTILLKKSG